MKSNKKRIIVVLAILTMALVLSCALVACDKAGTNKTGTGNAADYKVTIHPNNGQSDIVWDITKEIPTITKDGFHIAGYFLDAQLTISTTLESLKATGITKNIDVYVKWEEDVCEHVEVTDVAVAPTCTEKGLTEGKHCSKCGKILKAQTEIDALGHDLENHAGQPATCTEKGWKEYVTCKREGCDYTTYREIAALGHTPSNWIVDVAATCEKDGNIYKECTVCHVELERDTTSKLGHDIEHHAGQPATCTKIGWNEYDTCKRIGCGYTTYQEIPALGHTESIDAAVAPTCTEKGKTEGKHCSVCNTIIVAQTDIAALGHDIEHHDKKDATCTEPGWEAYDTCKRDGCTYTTYKAIAATGHTPSNWIVDVSATCENDGSVYKECSVCHVELERDTTSKLGHDIEHHGKKEATCTEIGWNEYDTCKRIGCGYTTYQEIPALGHTGGTATCTEQAVCTRCNEKYGDVLGHNYQNGVCTRCGAERASEGLEYSLNSDGNGYTVTGIGTCTDTELVIPSKHNSKPVTNIGEHAFSNCSKLTSITIPNSVTSIGWGAFYGCTGLTSVTIGKGVTSIGDSAFSYCTGLTSIYYTGDVASWCGISGLGNVMSGSRTLYIGGKKVAGDLIIPDSVISIGDCAFYRCTGLTSITIPDSVTSIGWGAFYGCTGLTSVTIPESVTSIGLGAFYDCSKLTSITIPASVTSIGEIVFSGCTGLTTIIVEKGNTKYHSDGNCLIETESKTMIAGCKNSIIPADGSVTSIGVHAFSGCTTGLTSITIPDSVTNIDIYAFAGCSGLTSVTIGNGVTSIGEGAFHYCTGLTSVTIGNSVTSIGHSAFENCTGLTSVYYAGTKEKWSAIKIASWNSALTSATLYYYSETEPALNADGTAYDGNFWHYDTDGNVVIWKKEN